jgi:hypothetical protein
MIDLVVKDDEDHCSKKLSWELGSYTPPQFFFQFAPFICMVVLDSLVACVIIFVSMVRIFRTISMLFFAHCSEQSIVGHRCFIVFEHQDIDARTQAILGRRPP